MTVARILCGGCGGALQATDERCPHCGAAVELPGAQALIACPQCGHRQRAGNAACEACGSALAGRTPPKGKAAPARPSGRPARTGQRSTKVWQIASLAAIGLVIVVLAWSEFSNEPPRPSGPASAPPATTEADLAPLEQAVADNPGDVHARLRLANALQDHGSYVRAIELYKQYLETHPEDPNARVDLGICYFELARTDSIHSGAFLDLAITEMNDALERVPTHQPAAFNLGIVHLTMGDLEVSNRWFERAAALDTSTALGRRARQMLQQHQMLQQE